MRLALAGLMVLLVVGGARLFRFSGVDASNQARTHTVVRGDLEITVSEYGMIEGASAEEVVSLVPGNTIIQWIIEDGSYVEAGDELVRLDSSSLDVAVMQQQIVVERAKAALIQAEMNHKVAQIALEEYRDGVFLKEQQDADVLITVAEEALRSQQNSAAYAEAMARKNYVPELELETKQFAVKSAEIDLASAQTAKSVLVDFSSQKMLKDLESQRDVAESLLRSEQAAFDIEQSRLDRLMEQVDACVYRAPAPGMVVYAKEGVSRSNEYTGPPIAEGATVREGQTMIRIPDLTQMQARVLVHESRLTDVAVGCRAKVIVQDREFAGTVTEIANRPASRGAYGTSPFATEVRRYVATVRIDGPVEGLRPAMTAMVEVQAGSRPDVLSVPLEAVVEQGDNFFCWVKMPSRYERRPVTIGAHSEMLIEITSGLAEGDDVLVNPRGIVPEARELASIPGLVAAASAPEQSESELTTALVGRGPMEVFIRADGLLSSAQNVDVNCLVPGETTIEWIIQDGLMVRKGEELVRLDSAGIEDAIAQQEIVVARARATQFQAEQAHRVAQAAVDEYLDGTYANERQVLYSAVVVAAENARSAAGTLAQTRKLARQGYVNTLQLEAQQFASKRTEIELASAQTALRVLDDFTKRRMVVELASLRDAAEAIMNAERTAYEVEAAQLEMLRKQLNDCTYYAPQDGMVVYANSRERQMEVGTQVYERRTIIRLPDLSQMQVEFTVHESQVDQLAVGMPAIIRILGRALPAHVTSVSRQPARSESWYGAASGRMYAATVKIDGEVSGLKPGQTAQVEVLITSHPDAVMVPLDAVVEHGDRHYAWVLQNGKAVRRVLVAGIFNESSIEVRDGLLPGETVILNPVDAVAAARDIANELGEVE